MGNFDPSIFIRYNHLFLLENRYLVVIGNSVSKKDICVQIFDDIKNYEKVKEFSINEKHFLSVMSDGRLVTCDTAGQITMHYILPQLEKRKIEMESALDHMDKDTVKLMCEYAGFFRDKSDKEKKQLEYEEVEHRDTNESQYSIVR
jgi:hypothetical protein